MKLSITSSSENCCKDGDTKYGNMVKRIPKIVTMTMALNILQTWHITKIRELVAATIEKDRQPHLFVSTKSQ
ncbi:hypothetical protein Y032_0097g2961 [Ancylostoma ceylanicum]|nr:hypothetical protein Y032_0097g2961 [Ancylostoma ceylanicum]